MSTDPKPEHRISNLEKEFMQLGSRIEEAASDNAEEFKAVRQDIKKLEEGMMSSFKELGGYFELTEKAMATKEGLDQLEARIDRIEKTMVTKEEMTTMEGRINGNIATMEQRLVDTIKQLWQQRPSE